jgi:hypothetical protein
MRLSVLIGLIAIAVAGFGAVRLHRSLVDEWDLASCQAVKQAFKNRQTYPTAERAEDMKRCAAYWRRHPQSSLPTQ